MTVEPADPFVDRLLYAMAGEVGGPPQGLSHPSVVRRVTDRSRLYFLGDGETPAFVAKAPLTDAPSDHPPLNASAQFAALRRSHDWFRDEDRHGVAEPIALFPELGVLVMRYTGGPTVGRVFSDSVLDPEAAQDAAWAAGDFLRRFHAHGAAGFVELDLQELVDELRHDAEDVLAPLNCSLPRQVREVLELVPAEAVRVRRVVRHGDYVGANLIVTGPRSVTMLDPALSEVGLPEDDLARFLAHLSSTTVFMLEEVWRPLVRLRLRLQNDLILAYGPPPNGLLVFELRLLRQHVLRWGRRVEQARARGGVASRARRVATDAHMRRLLLESAARLMRAVRAHGPAPAALSEAAP